MPFDGRVGLQSQVRLGLPVTLCRVGLTVVS